MRFFCFILIFLLPVSAMAQQRDSIFSSYDSYQTFVDGRVANRDFISLIQTLGGRDEYTKEQLNGIQYRTLNSPSTFC